ncbi:MAG: response regulator [Myxococcota bacterium]
MTVKILAVDDSKTMRAVMEMTFAGEDAEIVTVGSGDEALARARQLRPDVVFADASLDGMDGYSVSRAIKGELAETAIILMASQQMPYDEAKGASSGVDDHVAKPFDTQVVIDKVAEVLRKPRARVSGAPPSPPAISAPPPPRSADPQGRFRKPKSTILGQPSAAPAPPPEPPKADLGLDEPGLPPAPPQARPQTAPMAPPQVSPKPMPTPREAARAPTAPIDRAKVPTPSKPPAPRPASVRPARAEKPTAPMAAVGQDFAGKLARLDLTAEQVEAVLALTKEVVEQVCWEVVPDMAETLIREEIRRLTAE